MLIGREAERRVIEQLVAGARVGAAGVLLVTAEPGIGKTSLLDEAAALAGGLRILRARGAEAEREVPFAALLQLLRPALSSLDRIPGPQQSALASALALRPDTGTPADRFAVGAATLSLICRYAEDAPLALIIDDAHLLDRPSAEALLFAARRLVADPIVMLIAARAHEPHPLEADLPRLHLDGITLEAAQQLVQHLPGDLVEQLYQTVAGNPLALLELADDPDRLHRTPPGVPLPVPTMLAEAFVSRANRLSPDARTALLVSAIDDCELGAWREPAQSWVSTLRHSRRPKRPGWSRSATVRSSGGIPWSAPPSTRVLTQQSDVLRIEQSPAPHRTRTGAPGTCPRLY